MRTDGQTDRQTDRQTEGLTKLNKSPFAILWTRQKIVLREEGCESVGWFGLVQPFVVLALKSIKTTESTEVCCSYGAVCVFYLIRVSVAQTTWRQMVESSWNVMAYGDAREGKWRGELANGVGSQYSSHYLGTWCIQHYYRWCAHLGCQQSIELTPQPI